jgi:hypothetical protein
MELSTIEDSLISSKGEVGKTKSEEVVRPGNSARRLLTGVLPMMVFTLGTCELAAWAGVGNDITPSKRRLFWQSASRPK